MATSFQHDCPHCRTRRAGFTVTSQHILRSNNNQNFLTAICGVCDYPSLFDCHDKALGRSTTTPSDLIRYETTFPGTRFIIENVWPESSSDVPSDLPDNVARFFEQGGQNQRIENWDAAGAMFRKSLDVATKVLDPSIADKTLFQRINALSDAGRLTSDLAAWAHEVRIDGNDAVHGDDPETPEDVVAIHQFCRAVLLYCFTLPALVAARSNAKGG